MQPKISILIPTYNRKDYLIKCLDSIEPRHDIEVIISDNGSDYNVRSIIPEKLKYITKIIIRSENVGPRINVGQIGEHATGEYLYYISDDDYLLPGSLKEIINDISKKDFEIGFHDLRVERIKSRKIRWFGYLRVLGHRPAAYLRAQVLTGCIVNKNFHDSVYKTEKELISNSWYHVVYLLAYARNLHNINKVLAVHIWENETYWTMDPGKNHQSQNEDILKAILNMFAVSYKASGLSLGEYLLLRFMNITAGRLVIAILFRLFGWVKIRNEFI